MHVVFVGQKRAAGIILDASFFTPTQQLFDSLNWLPFRDRISYHKLILVYKILNNFFIFANKNNLELIFLQI
jgi:hypothetical protein